MCRGTARAYWLGFAICGGAYFLAAFYGDLEPNYRNEYTFRLITSTFLCSIDAWLNQLRPVRGIGFNDTGLEITMPVGHAVFTLVVGLLGGAFAEWLRRRQERSWPATRSVVAVFVDSRY